MNKVFIVLLFTFLLGCNNNINDLNEFIDRQNSKPVKPIDPLPQLRPLEVFEYNATAARDPFSNDLELEAESKQQTMVASEDGRGPDLSRRKEFLESYPLDSLLMVGTYQQGDDYWGLVLDPEGTITRVAVGHHLGHNHGQVVSIYEDEILLTEWINDGLGAWRERSAAMALKDE